VDHSIRIDFYSGSHRDRDLHGHQESPPILTSAPGCFFCHPSRNYLLGKIIMDRSKWKRKLLLTASDLRVLDVIQHHRNPNDQLLYVLTYHRVEELDRNPLMDPREISATPAQFNEHMKLISTKYHPVSAEEVLEAYHGGKKLPPDAVLVTVDDGYRDFADVIYPICQKFDIKPTLFVTTHFIGHGIFWWDKVFQLIQFSGQDFINTPFGIFGLRNQEEKRSSHKKLLHVLKQMPFQTVIEWVNETHENLVHLPTGNPSFTLDWDSLRELKQKGCAIGSHSHTHPILTQISREEVQNQVRISKELIKAELGECIPIFAIPDGKEHAFNHDILELIHQQGMDVVFHLLDGRMKVVPNVPISSPRIAVWQSLTLPHFHLRLTPLIDKKGNRNFFGEIPISG
jgi:peptidoglycan/xylan/chitin deacetylase (PgdA/CDA1 family)